MNKFYALKPFLMVLSWLIFSPQNHAAIIAVNVDGDSQNLEGDCSLRDAILSASINIAVDGCNAGESGIQDVIVIQVPGPIQLQSEIPVFDSVTIATNIGADPVTIIAAEGDRILRVNATGNTPLDFSVANVNFVNGDAGDEPGGAIYFFRNGGSFGTLELRGVIFENNRGQTGGALNFDDIRAESILIIDSQFNNNLSNSIGGAISSIDAISAESESGLEVYSNQFKNNHSNGSGGAAYIKNLKPFRADIIGNDFIANSAGNGGVVLDAEGGAMALSGAGSGQTTLFFLHRNLFLGNSADVGGGLRLTLSARATVTSSIFASNKANVRGGALFAGSGNNTSSTYLQMISSTVVNNQARFGDNIAMSSSKFEGNFNIIAYAVNGENCWSSSMVPATVPPSDNLLDEDTCTLLDNSQNTVIAAPKLSGFTDDPRYFPGFQPTANSPALDAGTGSAQIFFDINGNPIPVDGDGNGTVLADWGAFEAPENTDLIWQDNFGFDFGGLE